MSALVVCFSWTGRTEAVGRAVAKRIGADFEPIRDAKEARSLWRKLGAFVKIFARGVREIRPNANSPTDYSLVVIGTPVWGWSVTPSVRAYLRREAGRFPQVAFFCTEGGSGHESAFREMERLTGRKPIATFVVRQPDYDADRVDDLVEDFTRKLAAQS